MPNHRERRQEQTNIPKAHNICLQCLVISIQYSLTNRSL